MQMMMDNFNVIVLWMGAMDAMVIMTLGIACAVIYMFKLDATAFWDRVVPATSVLVGTSVAAGIVMLVARWISRMFA